MKQKRHKPEEIIRLLREYDGGGISQERFAQQKQISVATLHRWRKKYGQMDEADAKRLKALEKENTELKKMYAEAMLGIKVLQETIEKAVSVAHRRELGRQVVAREGCSQRQVCRFLRLNRSTYRYRAKFPSLQKQLVEQSIVDLSREHPELGAGKIGRLVRRERRRVSNTRVREVRREEGLTVCLHRKRRNAVQVSPQGAIPRRLPTGDMFGAGTSSMIGR